MAEVISKFDRIIIENQYIEEGGLEVVGLADGYTIIQDVDGDGRFYCLNNQINE